jgi:RNA polymerase sigma-70 factor, ECF subfamily
LVKLAIGKGAQEKLRARDGERRGTRSGRLKVQEAPPTQAANRLGTLESRLEVAPVGAEIAGLKTAPEATAGSHRLAAAYLQDCTCLVDTTAVRPVALVLECVAGRSGAWDAFVRRYAPLILAIARRSLRARGLSPAPDDLEDICENTFLALVKDDFALLRSYDDRFALSTFLGVVARTQAGRVARRRRTGASEIDVAELPSRCDDPAVAVEAGDLRAALRETLGEMPERDRQILTLFYFSDRDYREIALELKISANSVGAALHRARERLRARLEARERRAG